MFAILHRVALLVAVSVALVATGYGHRMPTAQDQALVSALANGATLADFCGTNPDQGGGHEVPCLACQITASAHAPGLPSALIDLELAVAVQLIAPLDRHAILRPSDPANRPQGPPVA